MAGARRGLGERRGCVLCLRLPGLGTLMSLVAAGSDARALPGSRELPGAGRWAHGRHSFEPMQVQADRILRRLWPGLLAPPHHQCCHDRYPVLLTPTWRIPC